MHARLTTVSADPRMLDQGMSFLTDHLGPIVLDLPGCLGMTVALDRSDPTLIRCLIATLWPDTAAMQASMSVAAGLRQEGVLLFGGRAEVGDWEVAAHRFATAGPPPVAGLARQLVAPPGGIAAVATAAEGLLASLPGLEPSALLVNRARDRGLLLASFTSASARGRHRDVLSSTVRDWAARHGARPLPPRDLEVVLSSIRLPAAA